MVESNYCLGSIQFLALPINTASLEAVNGLTVFVPCTFVSSNYFEVLVVLK